MKYISVAIFLVVILGYFLPSVSIPKYYKNSMTIESRFVNYIYSYGEKMSNRTLYDRIFVTAIKVSHLSYNSEGTCTYNGNTDNFSYQGTLTFYTWFGIPSKKLSVICYENDFHFDIIWPLSLL